MMNWDYGMNGWMGGWMWIPTVLIVALLVLGVVALVRIVSGGTPRQTEYPLAISSRRFVLVVIIKDEYDTVRYTLALH